MKMRPILFSGPMVRAILDGRETMTRRVVKPQPTEHITGGTFDWKGSLPQVNMPIESILDACPYGQPGDRLWVREEHYAYGRWGRDGFTKKGNPKWRFQRAAGIGIRFDAPEEGFLKSRDKEHPGRGRWYQRRARFMPKSATRIWLEMTGVRVERLHEISEADALSEGAVFAWFENHREFYSVASYETTRNKRCFEELWDKINGRESWDANPWVWVVEFRRV